MRDGRREALAAEERWLRDHRAEYEVAAKRLEDPVALRAMLQHCRTAHLTLECMNAGDSGEKACYLTGRAIAELERGLEDLRFVKTYQARERVFAAMKDGGEMPDLGLGLMRVPA